MFIFGDFDAATTDGLSAVLTSWQGLPEVGTDTVSAPGVDGVFYAQSTLGQGSRIFDLYARGIDPADVLEVADRVSAGLAPGGGLRDLRIDIAPGWRWRANTAAAIQWQRGKWIPGAECHLSAQAEFFTADPYGYASPDEDWEFATTAVDTDITRLNGNVSSFPTIELEATLTANQHIQMQWGGHSLRVNGPLTAAQTLRLDYQAMDFGVWNGATKTASALPRMSSFDRLVMPVGPTRLAVSTTGTLHRVHVHANSRRL